MEGFEKLLEIQQRLVAPKDQAANGLRYKYRKVEDIVERAKPIMKEVKCALVMTDDIECIGSRFYMKSTATLFDAETGKAIVANTAWAREPEKNAAMSEFQVTGSASSYARKYALCGLFAIDNGEKDPDELEQASAQRQAPAQQRQAAAQAQQPPAAMASQAMPMDPKSELALRLMRDKINPNDFCQYGWRCGLAELKEDDARQALAEYYNFTGQYKRARREGQG